MGFDPSIENILVVGASLRLKFETVEPKSVVVMAFSSRCKFLFLMKNASARATHSAPSTQQITMRTIWVVSLELLSPCPESFGISWRIRALDESSCFNLVTNKMSLVFLQWEKSSISEMEILKITFKLSYWWISTASTATLSLTKCTLNSEMSSWLIPSISYAFISSTKHSISYSWEKVSFTWK